MRRAYPSTFGEYVLAGRLGDGGGTVDVLLALASKSSHGDVCVIKKGISLEGADAEILQLQFRRRVDIALRLRHDAIAHTVGVGHVGGELYVAEEFVPGKDLIDVPRHEMPLAVVLYVVNEVASALAYVHAFENLGLVHRDVAPANIRLSFSGAVKLLDFGMATSPSHAGLTRTGAGFGREAYAAPEVLAGGKADRRSDVYSLGVVLWELLARRSYLEETVKAVGAGHAVDAPSVWNPEVSPDLDSVVAQAVAESPAERFADSNALGTALRYFIPEGFSGTDALRAFLAQVTDVEVENGRVARQLAAARAFAAHEKAFEDENPPKRGRRLGVLVGLSAAMVAFCGIWFGLRRNAREVRPPFSTAQEPARAASKSVPQRALDPTPPAAPPTPSGPLGSPGARPATVRRPALKQTRPAPPEADPSPKVPDVSTTADELLDRAMQSRIRGRSIEAQDLARAAIRSNGGAPAEFFLGTVLLESDDLAGAEAAFAEAVRLDPNDPMAKRRLEAVRQRRAPRP
jgi:serine/threonine protein kinase